MIPPTSEDVAEKAPSSYGRAKGGEAEENILPCICGAKPRLVPLDDRGHMVFVGCPECGRSQIARFIRRGEAVFAWNEEMRRIRDIIDTHPDRDGHEDNEIEFVSDLTAEWAPLSDAYDALAKARNALETRAPLYFRKDMMRIFEEVDFLMSVIISDHKSMLWGGGSVLGMIQSENERKKNKEKEDERHVRTR